MFVEIQNYTLRIRTNSMNSILFDLPFTNQESPAEIKNLFFKDVLPKRQHYFCVITHLEGMILIRY